MQTTPTYPPFPPGATPPKKGKGCFFWGCLTLFLIALVIILGFTFGSYYIYKTKITPLVSEYTGTAPVSLPTVEIDSGELAQVRQKVETFRQAARAQQRTTLELNAREINGLINGDPEFAQLKGTIYVTLDNDQIGGEVSIPLDQLLLKGRYLNGRVIFSVTTDLSGLNISIHDLEVNGHTPGADMMSQLQRINLADRWESDPKWREVSARLDAVRVENGVLKVSLK